jgi:hydrogenase maturation factor
MILAHESTDPITADPKFTQSELQAMHRYCIKYRDLVCSGQTPEKEQDHTFLLFAAVCYAEGIVKDAN